RAYVHHLMRGKHALGSRLLSIHNLRHYQVLMGRMREAILGGRFAALADEMRALWG
ncbi:MAG TPA: tRNA-guanine(34) transglycosylase, partial [Myxococcaceae bacterium]|nr:tRNA-guanine(34) transglycosylase [Myxococcaceae bacterium]